jgi:hypothetical protein
MQIEALAAQYPAMAENRRELGSGVQAIAAGKT